jgi:hypothetical protein
VLMYKIRGWSDHFENHKTREIPGPLPWFRCPTNLLSAGYLKLMRKGAQGQRAFAAWIGCCEVAARCRREERDGALPDVEVLADMIRWKASDLQSALTTLVEVGWIACAEAERHLSVVADDTQVSPRGEERRVEETRELPSARSSRDRRDSAPEPPDDLRPFAAWWEPAKVHERHRKDQCRFVERWPERSAQWAQLYRGMDVARELGKAYQWEFDNEGRRKTPRGRFRFLSGWLDRAWNSGNSRGGGSELFGEREQELERIREKEREESQRKLNEIRRLM